METTKTQRCSSGVLPEELILEILLRLRPNHLARCRILCKAWRRLATEPGLLLAHHSRQPPQPLLAIYPFGGQRETNCLEAVDLRSNKRRMVARFTEKVPRGFSDGLANVIYSMNDALKVHAACDGLLLLSFHEAFLVCNPTTHQRALLPQLRVGEITGFYRHDASGEYRVLYHRVEDPERKYYVFTLGSQQPRNIERRTSSAAVGEGLASGLGCSRDWPPVLLHGSLHWPPQQRQEGNILVFDTAAESFRWISPPAAAISDETRHEDTLLFKMEGVACHDLLEARYKDIRSLAHEGLRGGHLGLQVPGVVASRTCL